MSASVATPPIEQGIIPPTYKVGRPRVYPWLEMKIGDSFLVSSDQHDSIRSTAASAGRRYGLKFMTRTVKEGIRVWRVKL